MHNPYDVLGVSPRSTSEEIERAFQVAAFQAHPDNGGSAERFAVVTEAYRRVVEEKRGQFVPVGAPSPPAAKPQFALPPKVRASRNRGGFSGLTFRVGLAAISGLVALAAGFALMGFQLEPTAIVAGGVITVTCFALHNSIVVGFFQRPQRPLLLIAAAGVLLWPLWVGGVVAAGALALVLALNHRRGWPMKAF